MHLGMLPCGPGRYFGMEKGSLTSYHNSSNFRCWSYKWKGIQWARIMGYVEGMCFLEKEETASRQPVWRIEKLPCLWGVCFFLQLHVNTYLTNLQLGIIARMWLFSMAFVLTLLSSCFFLWCCSSGSCQKIRNGAGRAPRAGQGRADELTLVSL